MTTPAAAAPALEVRGLHKKYGPHVILHDIHLTVQPGEVYALTGPNGAGKTTLIRTVTGLAFPDSGEVRLLGRDVHHDGSRARAHLGAVVEAPARFYPQFTGAQNLMLHARLAAMAPDGPRVGRDRIREVLALLELTRMADRRVAEYSLGQRQRLGVASAILAHPRVLILDEPTSGLDALGIGLIHRIVTELAAGGCAVVLSTHHLREIATYAHTVGILTGGRLVDTVDLRARQAAYRFRVDDPLGAAGLLERLPFVNRVSTRAPYAVAHLGDEARVPEALAHLGAGGHRVYEASPDHFDLYEYYRARVEQA
ncbi:MULTISPECIES: ABC transporter ATP-binding protein [Deinococcus]|uniref:ABC-type transport system, ATPase component n=1 Tax=Deinococcus geothermalis (strain DSM 11300 / CIP 105573 / AG-3a) TaxID=319795 RepID=Q1IXC8_DEIGD|nr:ABC transporter ATP-binding protein [Deinococcus geothermalis]ABF46106.1 ABC-type transport system, ATPase component [Deinococcus geothermalis DSM 11300]MBI0446660.1 ABC transporter ATP-binding protein [Deinococcus sp. DB0503]